mgnify:CR=1 FL=1
MNPKIKGQIFTLTAIVTFAAQDGLSKYLATHYPPIFITMIRFWAFAAFAIIVGMRSSGGLRAAIASKRPWLQTLRGVLLVSEIVVFVFALSKVGMAITQSIFQAAPLLITALSVPILGEKVGWRRWSAVIAGLLGVLLIINPAEGHLSVSLLLPVSTAIMFAVYGIATRAVSSYDSPTTSLFYTGVMGAAAITLIGPFYWTPIAASDLPYLIALCCSGMLSHYMLIRAYAILPASEVQPLSYLQLVFEAVMAVVLFGEILTWNMIAGATIVVVAGLFTIWRENVKGAPRVAIEPA